MVGWIAKWINTEGAPILLYKRQQEYTSKNYCASSTLLCYLFQHLIVTLYIRLEMQFFAYEHSPRNAKLAKSCIFP